MWSGGGKFKAKVFYTMKPQWMKAESYVSYMWQIMELQGSWMTEHAVGRMDGVFLKSSILEHK